MEKVYTLTDLMQRYGRTRQALQQYIVAHLDELNADSEHVKKIKGDWIIDATAVKKIDEMRGYQDSLELADIVSKRSRETELLAEISTLKTAMLQIKDQYQREKEELYKQLLAEKDRAHAAELLQLQSREQLDRLQQAKESAEQAADAAARRAEVAEQKATAAEAAAKVAAKERDDDKDKATEKLDKIKDQYNIIVEENSRLKAALRTERQKSWLDKLLGR
jgi:methyl-accepting chemotaxis protein